MKYLVTAALPYANGPLHIGHIAGAYLPADIYVRHLRKKGEKVLFVCGSDEHGAPITIKSIKEKKTPEEVVNYYHQILKSSFEKLNISFDIYYRTSDKFHHEMSQKFFLNLYNKGLLIKKEVQQYYDEEYGIFLADRYIVGECPRCGNENAYGDQCEKCGSSISAMELINPRSILSGKEPVLKKTEHFFFPFGAYQGWVRRFLMEGYDDGVKHHNVEEWKSNVLGAVSSWINEPLQDRAITRDLMWGVKVPLPGYENKVLYVWFDAPIGYISAVYYYYLNNLKEGDEWWKDPGTRLIHFIGKDNIVFHCILFPIMLKAHGEYILPYNVPANEFLNLEDRKISTSREWAVWVDDFCNRHPERIDELRFVLCRIMPETKDANFTWEEYRKRVNEELVATVGNFISRFFNLVWRMCDGRIPESSIENEKDIEMFKKVLNCYFTSHKMIEGFSFRQALDNVIEIARIGNGYLSDMEPWRSPDKSFQERVIYNTAIVTWILCEGMEPFMPSSAQKLRQALNVPEIKIRDVEKIPRLIGGIQVGKYSHLFTYFTPGMVENEKKILEMRSRSASPQDATQQQKQKDKDEEGIPIETFRKIKIVVGEVADATRIPQSEKLIHLKVNIGERVIDVVAGIGHWYEPSDIKGKKIPVVVNLKKKKIMNVVSEGMVLVGLHNGEASILVPERDLPPGAVVE